MPSLHPVCCCGDPGVGGGGEPPACPAAVRLTLTGVNASRCTSCFAFGVSPFQSSQRVSVVAVDGTYTLPLSGFDAATCVYAAAVDAPGAIAWEAYLGAVCAGAPTPRSSLWTNVSVWLDRATRRVIFVNLNASTAVLGGPIPTGMTVFNAQAIAADPGAAIANQLACPGRLVGAGGGTASVTLL